MPKQKRWQLKRDLDQAINLCSTANEYIVRVGSQFKGVHDDYYQALERIYVALEVTIKSIREVKDII